MADPVSVPTLIVTGGPLDGTSYPLPLTAGETIVGSSMDAGVQIMLGNVEPIHARVLLDAQGLAIEDAGSATGTFVNGEKVEGRHALQEGEARVTRLTNGMRSCRRTLSGGDESRALDRAGVIDRFAR